MANTADDILKLIDTKHWNELTFAIDKTGFNSVLSDSKSSGKSETIYVEDKDAFAIDFYKNEVKSSEHNLQVKTMPRNPSASFVKSVENEPGIVSGLLINDENGVKGTPYVALGGRYTELDVAASYFHVLGLLEQGKIELAKQIAANITYMVGHVYSLKATNRIYHQHVPALPVYTSLVREIAKRIDTEDERRAFLKIHIVRSILDYERTWETIECLCETTHLSTFPGVDIPSNTLSFTPQNTAVAPVRLNMMLYKTELDIAHFIEKHTPEQSIKAGELEYNSAYWLEKAAKRKESIDKYLWFDDPLAYYDYDDRRKASVNTSRAEFIYALWAGAMDKDEAKLVIERHLNARTKGIGFQYDSNSLLVQAPEQIFLLLGLEKYGYFDELKTLATKWLDVLTKVYNDDSTLAFSYNVESGKPIIDKDSAITGWTLSLFILANKYANL